MKKPKVDHTTIRNNKLFCLNCGGEFALVYPIPVQELTKKMDSFNLLHADCKPIWKEPTGNQLLSVKEKAMSWINDGHVGNSSKTMWNCFMDNKKFPINHPYDPDDFSRCYKLLEWVPEWKGELDKLKSLSPVWAKLVDNWVKLTYMYELNVKSNWKNRKQVGMYEFMQTLIG